MVKLAIKTSLRIHLKIYTFLFYFIFFKREIIKKLIPSFLLGIHSNYDYYLHLSIFSTGHRKEEKKALIFSALSSQIQFVFFVLLMIADSADMWMTEWLRYYADDENIFWRRDG